MLCKGQSASVEHARQQLLTFFSPGPHSRPSTVNASGRCSPRCSRLPGSALQGNTVPVGRALLCSCMTKRAKALVGEASPPPAGRRRSGIALGDAQEPSTQLPSEPSSSREHMPVRSHIDCCKDFSYESRQVSRVAGISEIGSDLIRWTRRHPPKSHQI